MTTLGPVGDNAGVENRFDSASLPPAATRWVARRKAEVVAAVRSGRVTLDEVCRRYCDVMRNISSWSGA
ncbi:hypothetical+protein [Methylocapsa aurea]